MEALAVPRVFCDQVRVSLALDDLDDLRTALDYELDGTGWYRQSPQAWRHPDEDTACILLGAYKGTPYVQTSGRACAVLRAHGLFNRFLTVLVHNGCRESYADLTVEVQVDAPAYLEAFRTLVHAGAVQLSRKLLDVARECRHVTRPGIADGRLTGSTYLGTSDRSRTLLVYDKRNERLDAGRPDPGPLLRLELRLKRETGVSFRDMAEPDACYWHHLPHGVPLPFPRPTAAWVSRRGETPPRPVVVARTPLERLRRLLDASADVAQLRKLAADAGPGGRTMLQGWIAPGPLSLVDGSRQASGPQGVQLELPLGGLQVARAA